MTRSNLSNLVNNISFFQAKENKRTFAQFAANAISQTAQKTPQRRRRHHHRRNPWRLIENSFKCTRSRSSVPGAKLKHPC